MLARSARHSLGVTGIAILVAGAVAFLPLGPAGFAEPNHTEPGLAAATSIEALRSVFVTSAEAAAAQAGAPPAVEGSAPPTSGAAPAPSPEAIEAFGQALITSALQQAAPVVTPVRVAVPAPRATPLASVRAALEQSPWPADTWPTVERIIMCESSGNPAALSPAGYVGLMQVAPWLHGAVPADPVAQLAQAYDVYLRQGWAAWGCYYH